MSFTPESLPEPVEGAPLPAPIVEGEGFAPPEGVVPPPEPPFPAWRGWDVLGIAVFTAVTIFVFTLIALFVARGLPEFRHSSFIELATNAKIVIGSQAAAYPVILLFMFMLVRSRSKEPFGEAIRWNWPGATAPAFIACGVILALVVDGLARFLPIPKSLPMDTYFHDASSAYMMAAFGVTLAPLLEEVFFRGLLYPLLWRAFGLVTGVLLTALAFAGIHGAQLAYAWAPVLSIFVVGIVFTIVRVKTDSVASSFLMHCGYNFALFAALWLASDHYRHLEKVTG
jgi:membrane protease YdiL (CAAX protease family)